jgi:hypothetical protein
MTIQQKINAFEKLGTVLKQTGELKSNNPQALKLAELARSVYIYNGWFTEENVLNSYRSLSKMLTKENLEKWLSNYTLKEVKPKSIGLIMAGNIPLVGFHDILCVLMSGHNVLIKASGNDSHLPKCVAEILISLEAGFKGRIVFTDGQLKNIDAIIATGSNNSARYFEHYFGKLPHIIRKNRNSIAVLNGTETPEELSLLGNDIFQYFGLGCRNVSKVFVPVNYNLDNIFKAVFDKKQILQNNKYCNNYEYNKTVYLMGGVQLLENGFLLMKEDLGLASPVAVLFYEYYTNEAEVIERLQMDAPHIQCIVSKMQSIKNTISFGQTQTPELWDYADGVDTLKFLIGIQ